MDLKDLPVDGSLRTLVPGKGGFLQEKEVREIIEKARKNPFEDSPARCHSKGEFG